MVKEMCNGNAHRRTTTAEKMQISPERLQNTAQASGLKSCK